jgi:hypothetical protein
METYVILNLQYFIIIILQAGVVQLEQLDLRVNVAQMDGLGSQDVLDQLDQPDQLEREVLQEKVAPLVFRVREGSVVLLDLPDLLVREVDLDYRVFLDKMANQGQLDLLVNKVLEARVVHQVAQDFEDLPDPVDQLDNRDSGVKLESVVRLVTMVDLVQMDNLDPLENVVHVEKLARLDGLVPMAAPAAQVSSVYEQLVHPHQYIVQDENKQSRI